MYTTQTQVRAAFWEVYGESGMAIKPLKYRGKSQNELPADVRMAFVDFVDSLARDQQISEALAQRVTL